MMRKLILWLCLIALVFAGGFLVYISIRERWFVRLWENRPKPAVVAPGYYKVTNVADGDTISVDMNGTVERVRMIGVDTPETHDPDEPVQCYGSEAYGFTDSLLNNKQVRLEADPTNSNRDRYDRLLRYVYLKDDTLVNLLLIREGQGFAYTSFPFTKQQEFLSAEEDAKSAGKGLWGVCQYEIVGGKYQTAPAN